MRNYLVIVRAGPSSLHGRLIKEDPQRNWDCCINPYGAVTETAGVERIVEGGLNKFEGLEAVLTAWDEVPKYRYVLSLDDDVYFKPGDISRFFTICDRQGIYLAQPALSWLSFYNHRVTLRNPACQLRRVTFIEIMAPCFSADALEFLRPTFLLTKSTWGIDWAWTALCASQQAFQIVDQISVVHTKHSDPKNGAFYKYLNKLGVDPRAELANVRAQYSGHELVARNCETGHKYGSSVPEAMGSMWMRGFEKLKALARLIQSLRVRWINLRPARL